MHDVSTIDRSPRSPFAPVAAGRGGARRAWPTGIASRFVAAIARELRLRRDMRELRAMNAHMLRDIGLARADIEHAVRFGRDR